METKFSVIISHFMDDKYAVVLKAWTLDENNERVDKDAITQTGVTIGEAHQIAIDFVNKNSEVTNG